jgi:hypothetical protein
MNKARLLPTARLNVIVVARTAGLASVATRFIGKIAAASEPRR